MTSRPLTPGGDPVPGASSASGPDRASGANPGAPAVAVADLDSPQAIGAQVSAQLESFLAEKAAEFEAISPDAAAIGEALVAFTRGGKRIRPVLLWWGFQLAGGHVTGIDASAGNRSGGTLAAADSAATDDGAQADDDSAADSGSAADDAAGADGTAASAVPTDIASGLAQAAGSLELLHAAALIHDDVIDHSDTRRGQPSLHRQFEARHSRQGLRGDGGSFGVSASIVIGDICLALSEELFERAQETLGGNTRARHLRGTVRRDVMVGQYLDVLAEVISLDDARIADRAWEVLSFKSAKYSVEQPLLLGAALAGADDDVLAEISDFGLPLGQAFQLRDDVLGIAGDPQATGKPAGDDIREGKRTVLIAETVDRISAEQFDVLAARLGDPDLTDAEVDECVEMITSSGGLAAVEAFIEDKHDHAQALVDAWAAPESPVDSARVRIGRPAQERLKKFATALSYRTS
jgi:geranylgeranyl diphosphate synthase type I